MNVKSLWSSGVQWGTATTSRAGAYWQPDGNTPTGKAFVDVAVNSVLLTTSLQAASWNLGIPDFLADLRPNTASFSFKGQITATMGDPVVVSSGWGPAWAGRVDTITETRDVNGDYWTTVTATDRIGSLGAAQRQNHAGWTGRLDELIETLSAEAGIPVDAVDSSTARSPSATAYGIIHGSNFSGSLLEYINLAARSANAMVASKRDGTIWFVTRRSLLDTNQVSNGTFEVNTTGWSNLNTGAITRITTDFHSGVACAQIVSGAGYGGAYYTISGGGTRFVAGHTYRFRFWAKVTAGTGQWWLDYFNNVQGTGFSPTASWAQYSVDWTMPADASSINLVIRDSDATTGTLLVDDVRSEEHTSELQSQR